MAKCGDIPTLDPLSGGKAVILARAVTRAATQWGLTAEQGARLFGVEPDTWALMSEERWDGSVDTETVLRGSLILGIYRGLAAVFDGPLERSWLTCPNRGPLFNGRRPIEALLDDGIPTMLETRQLLERLAGLA